MKWTWVIEVILSFLSNVMQGIVKYKNGQYSRRNWQYNDASTLGANWSKACAIQHKALQPKSIMNSHLRGHYRITLQQYTPHPFIFPTIIPPLPFHHESKELAQIPKNINREDYPKIYQNSVHLNVPSSTYTSNLGKIHQTGSPQKKPKPKPHPPHTPPNPPHA